MVEAPGIRPDTLEDREYQSRIVASAAEANTLVVLPTGLGKTAIALRLIARARARDPGRSVLFLAPTRPLVVQHARSLEANLVGPAPTVLTGTVAPGRRWADTAGPGVIVATPQVIGNDLAHGLLDLERFSLIVFDEAHRAVGDYPYVAIGRANRAGPRARVLAMTASPGARRERIREIWTNLDIAQFEYRTADDPDVRPYVHGTVVEQLPVQMPAEVQELVVRVRAAVAGVAQEMYRGGLLPGPEANRRELLALGERLHGQLAAHRRSGESVPGPVWSAVTLQAVAMKAVHALELIESQGVESLRSYLERQARARPSPAQRQFLADPEIRAVRDRLDRSSAEHPKVEAAVRVVREEIARQPGARVLLFTQYRRTADVLLAELARHPEAGIRAERFVGQADHEGDPGLSQREQIAALDRFRSGEANCLVATSVAEEGLDIPATDLVVFYEPVPDVIRTIQRRGRTGRSRIGRAVVLVAQGTRDEALYRSSHSRERRMRELLEEVAEEARRGAVPAPAPRQVQRSLVEFGP